MQLKNIYPLAIVDQIDRPHEHDSSSQLKLVGGNFGNLAFRFATSLIVADGLVPWSQQQDKARPLLVTAANWLDPTLPSDQ